MAGVLAAFLGTFRTRKASFTARALKRFARARLGVSLDVQPLALSRAIRRVLERGLTDSKGRLWLLGEGEEGWRDGRRTLYRAVLAEAREVVAGA